MEFFYRCTECGRTFDITPEVMVCPGCREFQDPRRPLRGILEVGITGGMSEHIGSVARPGGQARFATGNGPQVVTSSFMPVNPRFFPPIPVGNTPMWAPDRLRRRWKCDRLYLKDDTANPTGSLKDRASFLVAAFARERGLDTIVVASTGNAACSMAGVGAAAGLAVTIFVPRGVPRAKLVQALQYGARVIRVDGDYDEAYRRSLQYVREEGGLSRNTGYNPLTIEGKKSVALEVFNQLGRVPDHVFVPAGDGVILCGVYKGFLDLHRVGLCERVPTIHAVQASGSAAIARAFAGEEFPARPSASTVADSISVGVPAAGYLALRNLKEHGGDCVVVSDRDILDAQYELSRETGLFAEPAAAAAYAGFRRQAASISPESVVVLLITGSGLKDIDSAESTLEVPE